jgi:hypothetical protein
MSSQLKSLQELFNKRLFRIPDYQRGYSWELSQIEAFWQDLNRISDSQQHYAGQLTIEPVKQGAWEKWDEDPWLIKASSYKPFYVVDGQQRLTTAVILIKCLLDSVEDDAFLAMTPKAELVGSYLFRDAGICRTYLFGYETDNPSYEYLKTQVLGQSSNAFRGTQTVYTANLTFARNFFTKQIASWTLDQIDDLLKRLTQRLVFNEFELDTDLDVFVAFETMNNRGKPLSKLELLKNRLIYLSTLARVDVDQQNSLRRDINNAWKTIYEYLGREAGTPLGDDDFLRAHWIIAFKYARDEADQFSTFLLETHFTASRILDGTLNVADIKKYVDSIQRAAQAWHSIHFPSRTADLPEDLRRGFERLGRLGRGAFAPLLIAALLKNISTPEMITFTGAAERFVFLVSRLTQRRSSTGDNDFYRLAGQLYQGEISIEMATAAISDRTNRFFSLQLAQVEMHDLFKQYDGFYSWSGCRYFLFEFEQSLREKAKMVTEKIDWINFNLAKKDYVTIEHIFPQSPIAGEWPTFEGQWAAHGHALQHSLGNLLPLSQGRNSKLSNRSFAKKKQNSETVNGYFNGSYSEIAVAQLPDWTPFFVLDRGLSMLDFLELRWQINLGSREEKIRLLNLQFLEPSAQIPPVIQTSTTD